MMRRPTGFGYGDGYEYIAANALRMMQQAGDVAEEALTQIDAGTYDARAWSTSVIALMDVGLQGYLDCASAVLGGGNGGDPTYSADVTVPADATSDRDLCLTVPLTRVGRPDEVVPGEFVGFAPAVLPAGATTFQIVLTDLRYAAANYDATVGFRRHGADPTSPVDQTIAVSVAL